MHGGGSADRPSMLEVDSLLKNEGAAIGTPKRPAFSVNKREVGSNFTQSMMLQFQYLTINKVISGL